MDSEENRTGKLGMVSLWTAILGIVVPVLIAILVAMFGKSLSLDQDTQKTILILGVMLCFGLELTAFVTGISSRKTGAGKGGLIISSICFGMMVLSSGVLVLRVGQRTTAIEQEKTKMTVQMGERRIQSQK